MNTSPTYYGTEITPETIAEITRRAHHERSQAMWRLLEGIFKSRAVVIIGGMGSLGGAAIGALLVGLADNFGKALFPEVSYFTLYAPMALILAVKPTGLFGRE